MTGVVVAVVIVVLVAVAVMAFLRQTARHHPENSAGHAPADEPAQPAVPPMGDQRYPGVDRPGGPGAESQVPAPGSVTRQRPPSH